MESECCDSSGEDQTGWSPDPQSTNKATAEKQADSESPLANAAAADKPGTATSLVCSFTSEAAADKLGTATFLPCEDPWGEPLLSSVRTNCVSTANLWNKKSANHLPIHPTDRQRHANITG